MEANVKISDVQYERASEKIPYIRRLDRTPEKDFHLKSNDEKKMVCKNRASVRKVKDKITRLENEVDEREKEVESERKLRKEAEDKLQSCLKDMYNNENVNDELRQRLPRANKSDPFKRVEVETAETDLSEIEEQIVEEDEEKSETKPRLAKKDIATNKQSLESKSPKSSPQPIRRTLNFLEEASPSGFSEPAMGMERHPSFMYSAPMRPGYYGGSFGASSSYMPYTGYHQHSNMQHPMNYGTPPYQLSGRPVSTSSLHMSSVAGFAQTLAAQEQSLSLSQSQPNLSFNEQSPLVASTANTTQSSSQSPQSSSSESSPSTATTTTTTSSSGSPSDKPTTAILGGAFRGYRSLHASPDSGIGASSGLAGSRSFTSPLRPGTSALPDPFLSSTSPRMPAGAIGGYMYDHNKHINSLLNEIDLQKEESRKLQNELANKQTEIETLKLTLKTQGVDQASNSELQRAAGIVEEVYAAQRKRDEATTARMKLANEERDDVMTRLRQLEARIDAQGAGASYMDQGDDDLKLDLETLDNNEDMYVMLSRLDSPTVSENDVSTFVQRAEAVRHRQREVMSEELQVVIEQRDVALAKCRKLEEELLRYQKDRDADGGMDKSIKAQYARLQQERDLAVAQSQQLDNEVQALRLYYGLHKSLSGENSVRQQANLTLHAAQEDLNATRLELETAQKENARLAAQCRTTTIDKKQLEQALESVSQDKERLQRLVAILKRKINADKPTGEEEQQ